MIRLESRYRKHYLKIKSQIDSQISAKSLKFGKVSSNISLQKNKISPRKFRVKLLSLIHKGRDRSVLHWNTSLTWRSTIRSLPSHFIDHFTGRTSQLFSLKILENLFKILDVLFQNSCSSTFLGMCLVVWNKLMFGQIVSICRGVARIFFFGGGRIFGPMPYIGGCY